MAASLVGSATLGPLQFIWGTFDQVQGAAEVTYAVSGKVLLVAVNPVVSGAATAVDVRGGLYTTSLSGAITTITFQNVAAVTGGTFLIVLTTGT